MTNDEQAKGNGLRGLEAVKAFMRDAKWRPQVLQETPDFYACRVKFDDDFPIVSCLLELYIDQQQFVCYLNYEPSVPQEKIAVVSEFLARVNYGMKIGNFEIDFADGSVRYKSSVCFAGVELGKFLVHNTVIVALNSVQPYSEAYLSVLNDDMSPEAAIATVEG
jgi:hypothetical protein